MAKLKSYIKARFLAAGKAAVNEALHKALDDVRAPEMLSAPSEFRVRRAGSEQDITTATEGFTKFAGKHLGMTPDTVAGIVRESRQAIAYANHL